MLSFCKRNGERRVGHIWWREEAFNTFKLNSNFGIIRPKNLTPYFILLGSPIMGMTPITAGP